MYIPDKYYSKTGKYLTITYLIVASIILLKWVFPGSDGNVIKGLHCGSGNFLSDSTCLSDYPLENPNHGLIETLLFSLPIIPSAYLVYILDPKGERVYANFLSYILWNIFIWLAVTSAQCIHSHLIGLGITKLRKVF